MLPPDGGDDRVVDVDGGPRIIFCDNSFNLPEVSSGIRWFRLPDRSTSISTNPSLFFATPISRESAGEYECQVMSLIDGTTRSTIVKLTVNCKHTYFGHVWLCRLNTYVRS